MKKNEIELFEKIYGQLKGFHNEISALSKKKPNDGVNEFKLKLINQVLEGSNKLLKGNDKPLNDFEKFDIDSLPTNSDVTFILNQYIVCLDNLKSQNVENFMAKWYWSSKGVRTDIRTSEPKRVK